MWNRWCQKNHSYCQQFHWFMKYSNKGVSLQVTWLLTKKATNPQKDKGCPFPQQLFRETLMCLVLKFHEAFKCALAGGSSHTWVMLLLIPCWGLQFPYCSPVTSLHDVPPARKNAVHSPSFWQACVKINPWWPYVYQKDWCGTFRISFWDLKECNLKRFSVFCPKWLTQWKKIKKYNPINKTSTSMVTRGLQSQCA